MNTTPTQAPGNKKQQGAVLVVSLMILLVMTLLGLSSMQGTILEEKMSGNMRDRNLALQSSEVAMRDGETFVNNIVNTSQFNDTEGLYALATSDPDYFISNTWVSARTYSGTMPAVKSQPRYVVKHVGDISGAGGSINIGGYSDKPVGGNVTTFRITSRGTGGRDTTQVLLQTHYGKRF
ncbi:MAG: hypothetical protein GXP22_11300 [Gammaproteobacteria bacterium]|nr:hypothetical protein [Gammaproteobacteria bacterium]